MTNTNTAGLATTYPYEATSPGIARHQCEECGAWERADKGAIKHGKRCESRPQATVAAVPTTPGNDLSRFAAQVRSTGLTKGRDQDTSDAVRLGYLSTSTAMNTDD